MGMVAMLPSAVNMREKKSRQILSDQSLASSW
jgi:hypothetical protein